MIGRQNAPEMIGARGALPSGAGTARDLLRIRKFDPCRRVIAGLFPSAHVAVDACRFEALRYGRAEQQMVDARSGVAAVSVPKIVPEGIDTLVRMECSQRIGPALADEASVGVAD